MKRIVFLFLSVSVLCLAYSCRTKTVYIPVNSVSTKTEVLHDTVLDIQLVPYRDSVAIRDTSSCLENAYASSLAIWSDNMLHHSLTVKNVSLPVRVIYKNIIQTDSIQVPYEVIKIQEVNRLNVLQSFQIWCGRIFLLLLFAFCAFWALKYIRLPK